MAVYQKSQVAAALLLSPLDFLFWKSDRGSQKSFLEQPSVS